MNLKIQKSISGHVSKISGVQIVFMSNPEGSHPELVFRCNLLQHSISLQSYPRYENRNQC